MITIQRTANRFHSLATTGLVAAYLVAAAFLFARDYLLMDSTFVLGCLLGPYLFIIRHKGEFSCRYLLPAAIFGLLAAGAPVRTFQYMTFAFAFLFLLEIRLGKLNSLPLVLMVLLSPVFRYGTEVFGFPIRLQLSQWAGWLISWTGNPVQVEGNLLVGGGFSFAVDPACVGLQLVSVSFLIALFLLAHFERSTGKRLSLPLTAGSLLAVSGLVVLANLIRIVLLVLFKILPAHPMHDLIGLLCLVFYVILPSILLVQWLYRVNGQWLPLLPSTADQTPRYGVAGPAALLVVLVLLPLLKPAQPARQSDPPFNSLPGYRATALPDGITKLEREESLVYVKPVAAFYSTEHSPLICWRGSGYSFGRISRQQAQGQALYTGMLQKGADMLYTAWWFDNGQHRTISQWEWRWNMLLGAPPYSLVNVSAATPAELQKALAIALRRD